MQIKTLKIENFRSLRRLQMELDETTVIIGPNNTGKTAILEATRIALSRRWGKRGTGFTEYDVHRHQDSTDCKSLTVSVTLTFRESQAGDWNADMVAALEELVVIDATGRNLANLRVTCQWSQETEAFEPSWEFLDEARQPLTARAQRAANLNEFFSYVPLFFLAALRNANEEFASRSAIWGRLLRSIRIPGDVEEHVQTNLDAMDAKLLAADPKLAEIAKSIGQATKIAITQGVGDARLRMLPMDTWDLISRASVVLRNEELRPWLPLSHHGQGLQSLAVIFLFQTAVLAQLSDDQVGTEPLFLLEEPEAHLHPQAARTLWERLSALPGQKIVTTHSPYFVQKVPLHNLRLARLEEGETHVSALPRTKTSRLKWNSSVAKLAEHQGKSFSRSESGFVQSDSWFDEKLGSALLGCYKDEDPKRIESEVVDFRHECRVLITRDEEHELSFLGRRIRGEIFFARRWILVEGQSDYVLMHAIGRALGYQLDMHGIAVIDFQNNGDAAIYPALASGLEIPWWMITDGDGEAQKFKSQLLKRGFLDRDLLGRLSSIPAPRCLEDQLVNDGHENLLRQVLAEVTSPDALTIPLGQFMSRLKNNKTACISRLALRVESDQQLALSMPTEYVEVVVLLKAGA